MIRQCRHCRRRFTPTRLFPRYCGETCWVAACERTCQRCGKRFHVDRPKQVGKYCDSACRLAAVTPRAAVASIRSRRVTHRIHPPCAWEQCQRKADLLDLPRSRGEDREHFHPECYGPGTGARALERRVRGKQGAAHTVAATSRRSLRMVEVTCTRCHRVRRYQMGHIPQAVDVDTMTYVCRPCLRADQPSKTVRVTLTCLYCGESHERSVYRDHIPTTHFCNLDHWRAYYRPERHCLHCGTLIQRKGAGARYCDSKCYAAAREGKSRAQYRPSQAELRIQEAYDAGVRGVRPLARAGSASVNTVQKFINAGKLVEVEAPA